MAKKKYKYSFNKGWKNVPIGKAKEVKNKLMILLECKYHADFYKNMNGRINIPEHIYRGVNDIFSEFGLSPVEIWEIEEVSSE